MVEVPKFMVPTRIVTEPDAVTVLAPNVLVPVAPAFFVIAPVKRLRLAVSRVPVVPDPHVNVPQEFVWLIPRVIVPVYPELMERLVRAFVATSTVQFFVLVPSKMTRSLVAGGVPVDQFRRVDQLLS